MTASHLRLLSIFGAILAAAAMRLAPHPWNFTPIGAMALFSGAHLGRRIIAFAAPLGALLLSDVVLGFYRGQATVYFAVALIVLMGMLTLKRVSGIRLAGAAVASSVLFFVITNLGMWLFSGFYPLTFRGLQACFAAAIPFFQNTAAGDLFFVVLLFGGFAVAEQLVPKLRTGRPQTA